MILIILVPSTVPGIYNRHIILTEQVKVCMPEQDPPEKCRESSMGLTGRLVPRDAPESEGWQEEGSGPE